MTKKPAPTVVERTLTPRAAIHDALLGESLTTHAISERASIREKDVAAHLEHLERSVKQRGERLVVTPAECLACTFVFRDRRKFTTPSACPACRSERIAPPSFRIEMST